MHSIATEPRLVSDYKCNLMYLAKRSVVLDSACFYVLTKLELSL